MIISKDNHFFECPPVILRTRLIWAAFGEGYPDFRSTYGQVQSSKVGWENVARRQSHG